MMPYLFPLSAVPDGSFQSVLPPTIEFDSAAAALRIFYTKVLERKSLNMIPIQREQPPFSLDSTAACQPARPALIVLPLPSAPAAPGGTTSPIGPIRPQYTVACQESGKDAHVYPTHSELHCRTPQHHLHCYKAEAELLYEIFFLIKLNWLDKEDL